jgi:hypothetical protein
MANSKKPQHKRGTTQPSSPPPPTNFRWFFGHVFSIFRRHGNALAFWICIAYLGHLASVTLIAFAGKQSLANFAINLAANIDIVWTVSVSITGLSITLYLRERRLHRKTRERLTARTTELELMIDPNRTSSLLTSKGLTRKEDV